MQNDEDAGVEKFERFKRLIDELEKNKTNIELTNKMLGELLIFQTMNIEKKYVEWVKGRAEAGNSYAQDFLGDVHYLLRSVDDADCGNCKEAIRLFKLSADRGNSHAQYNLAFMYQKGIGCKVDKILALDLAEESKNAGCESGKRLYETIMGGNGAEMCKAFKDENKKLKRKNEELMSVNGKLEQRIEELTTELEYMPGGVGYERAKKDAESIFCSLRGASQCGS